MLSRRHSTLSMFSDSNGYSLSGSEEVEFDLEVDTSEEAIPRLPAVLQNCPQFRILIIGQSGVGKSTICSRVFNISGQDAGVSHRQRGQDKDQVWQEALSSGQNKNIILHDSGGFEAGGEEALEEIKAFIRHRRAQPNLVDQLHCIWYCISCDSPRPFQSAEDIFFRDVDKGDIPVIVVFTKFDLLMDKHYLRWRREYKMHHPDVRHLPDEEGERIARLKAEEDYDENYRKELLQRIEPLDRVDIMKIAILPTHSSQLQVSTLQDQSSNGVGGLIDTTLDHLTGDNQGVLRILWAAAQRSSADLKIQESLLVGMSTFWRVVGSPSAPFVPLVGAAMTYRAFNSIVTNLSAVWGFTDPHHILNDRNARNRLLEGCFDSSIRKAFGGSTVFSLVSLNITAPLTAPSTATVLLKTIASVTLILERLFLKQMSEGGPWPLSNEMVDSVVREFRNSKGRWLMVSHIDGSVDLGNCYKIDAVKEILERATRLARAPIAAEYSRKTSGA